MDDQHVREWKANGYRTQTRAVLCVCYLFVFVAVTAPVVAYFDHIPIFEDRAVWFQRSGALTTIFALLATTLRDFGSNALYAGGFGEQAKLNVKIEFHQRFSEIFVVGFFLTVLGTVIWGYGDTILKLVHSPGPISDMFGCVQ